MWPTACSFSSQHAQVFLVHIFLEIKAKYPFLSVLQYPRSSVDPLSPLMQNFSQIRQQCHKVTSEFFATNTPDQPYWTLNWYFGAFRNIWVHSEMFGCLMKLGAKRAELVQKFVPRSRVGIFRNERTRSSPLDPKLTFWCVWYYLCAFVTVWLPYKTRCKTGRCSAKVCATKSLRNVSQRTHPIHPIGP